MADIHLVTDGVSAILISQDYTALGKHELFGRNTVNKHELTLFYPKTYIDKNP